MIGIDCNGRLATPAHLMLWLRLLQDAQNPYNHLQPVPDPLGLLIVHRLAGEHVTGIVYLAHNHGGFNRATLYLSFRAESGAYNRSSRA